MPSPFTTLDAEAIRALMPKRPSYAAELDDFLAGDMWRDKKGWLGELPTDAAALLAMRNGIVSENILDELLFGYVAAVTGKEPRWQLVPLAGERPNEGEPGYDDIHATEEALTQRWDDLNLVGVLQEAAWHMGKEGRGPLRLTIPLGLRDDNGAIPRQPTLADALSYIYIDALHPADAGLSTDRATRMSVGIVITQDDDGKDIVEWTYYDPDRGLTVLRQEDDDAERVYDLGGRLFLEGTNCDPLITPQLVQIQKAFTLTLTQLMRNINIAGSPQVDYINTRPPGEWVAASADDPGARFFEAEQVYKRFVPERIGVGAGVRNFLQGNDIYNADGEKIGVTNPNVHITPPVDVTHFEQTYRIFQQSAYTQAHQSHLLRTSDANMSGIALEQARARFATACKPLKTALDKKGRWMIEAMLALAGVLMGRPGLFAGYRCDFNTLFDSGPLSADEQEQIRANYREGLFSRETSQSMLGIDDVAAEQAKIDAEQERSVAIDNQRTDATVIRAGLLRQNPAAAQLAQAVQQGGTNEQQQQQAA